MTYEWQDIFEEEVDANGHIPQGCQDAQRMLNRFVEINHEAGSDAAIIRSAPIDANFIGQQIVDIIRNNPPLKSVPTYFQDGRENYLWYSDFYDDAGKDVFGKYRDFTAPDVEITPVTYTIELAKIDLPYFRELVNLISLLKLEQEAVREEIADVTEADNPNDSSTPYELVPIPEAEAQPDTPIANPEPQPDTPNQNNSIEESKPQPETHIPEPVSQPETHILEPEPQPDNAPAKEVVEPKRSYEPKLSKEQYALLAGCIEDIKLFRRPVKVAQLKKLLGGLLTEPLQVMNQLSLVYLLDQMREAGFIKKAWMTTASQNRDFISFRTTGMEQRYGSAPHFLTMDQLKSRRSDSKRCYIEGGNEIDDTIELMKEKIVERR